MFAWGLECKFEHSTVHWVWSALLYKLFATNGEQDCDDFEINFGAGRKTLVEIVIIFSVESPLFFISQWFRVIIPAATRLILSVECSITPRAWSPRIALSI